MAHQFTPVGGELGEILQKTFTNYFRTAYIKVDGCILPENYKQFADAIENFEVRDDDIWVCSYPKTGTTWTQEMVWSIANNLNFERAKIPLPERFPYLEFSPMFEKTEIIRRNPGIVIPEYAMDSPGYASKMPSPRFIKTHLPFHLLPRQLRTGEKKPKILYVVRNPKDTCISFYHHCKLVEGYNGTFEEFYTLFLGESDHYGPFWMNVLGYWKNRKEHNILWLTYEDMKQDLSAEILRTAIYLGNTLNKVQLSLLTEHLSFASMKANPAVNYEELIAKLHEMSQVKREGVFMRSGTTKQWKSFMTPELIERFDEWTEKHLKGTGLAL
ncbi:luciferin sulfotransferase-like [Neodiprion fabricii]|uniref:luciferin sulfotransferase-like n=1 Tax=Neodiprion fabricii TaxID=2872261 RepID=UPI001ED954D9|nr:luciferin sulfotransferase-like [Neodiprion fabricii]